ncbi:hypothetical protein MKZ38_007261 [Zalerion maritima]|uniref:Sulfotransferase n=1 Tax=Zalerion maritima TaxID=339359 RepID=A0AAD5RWZ1_9PEZI|nr:hypothetical protein MKZ38_007261 [Zalerion maritima]
MTTPREIDRWPEPESKRGIKLMVVSASRTGTMGIYQALKILGYRPYHMAEVVYDRSGSHMKVVEEAILAHHNDRFSGIKPYGRKEFDKWLADYDALLELQAYLGPDMINAYLSDPDVKFILTERDPDKWVRSFNQWVAVDALGKLSAPLVAAAARFDTWLTMFKRLNIVMYNTYSNSIPYKAPGNEEALRKNYVEYIAMVKRIIPPERLCVIRLEDGLGWEQICPYLEKDIPKDTPYPRGTDHIAQLGALIGPIINGAIMKMAAVVVPAVGVAGWLLVKKGPVVVDMVRGLWG